MDSFAWFLVSMLLASVSVGLLAHDPGWGFCALAVLCALRNAVMAGYVEGRFRYEHENSQRRRREWEMED